MADGRVVLVCGECERRASVRVPFAAGWRQDAAGRWRCATCARIGREAAAVIAGFEALLRRVATDDEAAGT